LSIISAAAATALVADGAYAIRIPAPPNLPAGPASNVLAIVGTFTHGKINTPTRISTASSPSSLLAAVGNGVANGAIIANSGVREALNASPECTEFLFVRASDDTETSAVLTVVDGSGGTIGPLISIDPGSDGNGMTLFIERTNGTAANSPVYRATRTYPNNVSQVFSKIVGYATLGGPYNAAAFWASLSGAINGTAPQRIADTLAVAGQLGTSTAEPALGMVFQAVGGTNGDGNVTTQNLLDAMQSLKGQGFGGLILAGCYDLAAAPLMAVFLDQVGGLGFPSFPPSTSTATAQAQLASSPIAHSRIIPCIDGDYVVDESSQQSSLLVGPAGAVAGIIMGESPWVDPSNKPDGRTKGGGFLGTERTLGGIPIDPQTEGALRKTLGLQYVTNGSPRSGGYYGLAHGKASDGSNIADTRMFDYIATRALAILNRYVGRGQTPPPASGQLDNDPTRRACNADFEKLKHDLISTSGIGGQKLAAFRYQFVSSADEVAAKRLRYQLFGRTLAGIEFAIGEISVGTTVAA